MKKIAVCFVISLGIAALLLFLENKPFYQILDLKLYDHQMNLRQAPVQDRRILYVNMDDAAIDQLGRWPWPRNIFANITNTLTALGTRQIVFDVTFAQPSQVFIHKEAVEHIFQGQDDIDHYITDEIGVFKGRSTVTAQDTLWTLQQIQNGFLTFAHAAQQKLQAALIDNDKILEESFKNSQAFIGFSFEVLTEQTDIIKDRLYTQIQENMTSWVNNHLDKTFNDLPASLKATQPFSEAELQRIFARSRLQLLIQKDIEIPLNKASEALQTDPSKLKSDFYLIKHQLIEEKIQSALENDPQTQFIDMIYRSQIFDPDTQQSFQEVWSRVKKEFEAKVKFGMPSSENQEFLTAKAMEAPIEQFTQAVQGGGFLNGIPDSDGVLRSVPLFIKYKDKIFSHIALTSILHLTHPQKISFDPGRHLILHNADLAGQLKDIHIPIDHQGKMLVNWTGRWQDTFRHISGSDIYRLYYLKEALAGEQGNPGEAVELKKQAEAQEKKLREMVNKSICIIGLTAAGTHDFNPTPYESTYPMVGTHGNVVNSILTEQFITQAPHWANVLVVLLLSVVIGLCLPFLSSLHGLLFTAIILAGTFLTSLYWFHQGIWFHSASPILLSLFSFLGITSYKFSTEEKSKRAIKNAFSKYVSPDVIEEIMKDPSKLRLGGDRKTLTVLFSDIRSFTTYSEKRKPEEIVSILNEYLDAMTKVIVEHKGTLDKYVGDEIMAVFGAPKYEPPEVNAQRAVICGMKMLERLKILHTEWQAKGLEPLDIGIGVNTGEMVVGNMGSELRMDYTVIGDAVNLGARIEALTRDFHSHFIISESTYEYVKNIVEVKPLQSIKVKGKEIPVMIYDVCALTSDKILLAGS
jgi:adenylate cyclase